MPMMTTTTSSSTSVKPSSAARRRRGIGLFSACRAARLSSASAHGLLDERGDPPLRLGGQLLQRELGRPHGAVVEVRLVAEAERRVAHLELRRGLEEAD